MIRSLPCLMLAANLTAGCAPGPENIVSDQIETQSSAPPGAAPGTCWGQDIVPAVVETVTEQVLLEPARRRSDGTLEQPAVYKTETRQNIIRERRATWFQAPCPDVLTPEFVGSLQRALKARGHYRGPITGELDARTRRAIRAYQQPQGLESGTLSLTAARRLGLIAVDEAQ